MKKISRIIPGFSILLIQGLLFLAPLNVCSQEPMAVPRLPGELFFDGVPDEEAWQKIAALPLVMHMPVYGNEPTELSVIKIAYDNDYLYVSGIINYKNPDNIRAFSKKRDYNYPKCDWLGIVIDTFYDRQNAVMFWTNPNGLRSEGTIQNDAVDASTDMSFSWNTFWDVETNINDKGWSTELRIPFSSLRFQTIDSRTLMGLTIVRWSPGKSELATFPVSYTHLTLPTKRIV